jgi:uncharacterized membrane protein
MEMTPMAILRAIHILAAGVWVGAAMLNAFFLVPSIIAAGPGGGQVMREMAQVRRLPVFMNTVMLVTLITGLGLYPRVSGGFAMSWIASGAGITLTFGALLAIATGALGLFVTVPTVKRIGRLGAAIAEAGGPPSPAQAAEMGALQRRLLGAARVGTVLVVVATLAMALARYV